jgi:hypothetical protein
LVAVTFFQSGRLVSLAASNPQENFPMAYNSYGQMGEEGPFGQNGNYYMQRVMRQRPGGDDGDSTTESTGNNPNAMDFDFMVQATFKLDLRTTRPKAP